MMPALAADAIRIYRRRGLEHLLLKFFEYAYWRVKNVTTLVFTLYWNSVAANLTYSVGGVSAEFDSHSERGGAAVRRRLSTEYEMLGALIEDLRADDVFYDIGANVGTYSAFASQICSRTVAFEPHPPNFEQLQRNLAHNGGAAETYQIALSSSNGEVSFDAPENTVGYGAGSIGSGSQTVQMGRGETLVATNGLETPTVAKIDVEGAEGLVIDGMRDVLSECRALYVELHLAGADRGPVRPGSLPAAVLSDLDDMGFAVTILQNRGAEIQIVAERPH